MADLKSLIKQRGTIKAKLTRFKTYFDSISKQDEITQLKIRLQKIEQCWLEFEKIQTEIELMDDSCDQLSERDKFESEYFSLVASVQDFISAHTSNGKIVECDSKSQIQPNISVKLPDIQLPIFSGDYDQWLSFHDTFTSIIDSNQSMPNIHKFHYLKCCLKGEASKIIQSLESSSENYSVAWKLLCDRYGNKKFLISQHVSALFNLQKIDKFSSISLRYLLDTTLKHIRALTSLGQPTDKWDTLLIHLITSKLDIFTFREWENKLDTNNLPTMSQLEKFLQHKCQVLESVENNKTQQSDLSFVYKNQSKVKPNVKKNSISSNYHSSVRKCLLCEKFHALYFCDKFKSLSIADRESEVKKLKLCFNCLSSCDHKTKDCKAGSCKLCGKRHNTLLHFPRKSNDNSVSSSSSTNSNDKCSSQKQPASSASHISSQCVSSSILLSTAVVSILDNRGSPHLCRVLLDSGSQSNFISEKMVKKLGLPTSRASVEVNGIGKSSTKTSGVVQCVIKSRLNSFSSTIECVVLKSITTQLPTVFIEKSDFKIPPNFQLADPHFNQPGDIDLLVGAELFFNLLCEGKFKFSDSAPTLQNSVFGWIVSGKVNNNIVSNFATVCHHSKLDDINKTMEKFWDIEECSEKQYTGNDKLCEDLFVQTTSRDDSGRYCVQIPLKDDVSQLGESHSTALRRLLSMERRFSANPELQSQYINFMKEYEALGHMKEVSSSEIQSAKAYYIPHHAVLREDSTTTKLRVVFDASSKTSSGVSLNDISMVGPTVQSDLISIIIKFRTHPYVMTADVEKMYRQVNIQEKYQNLQLILWREHPQDPIKTFKLLTVTYGTASAPYLATRALKQLALDEQDSFPSASKVVIEDFYVDDVMTGAKTIQDAIKLQQDLSDLTHRGGFHLRKWSANHPDILSDIPAEDVATAFFEIDEDISIKTLGLIWNPRRDVFQFSINPKNMTSRITKRAILSAIGQIFDPLGLIGPVILVAKLIMQQLWSYQIGWDEEVPEELIKKWTHFHESLHLLSNIRVPRAIVPKNHDVSKVEIHGFADASESAYGACIYLKVIDADGNITVNLVTSKSRVAPLRKTSLPRLELCAALLLSQLCKTTINALHLQIDSVFYYTDSTITLAWINAPSSHWATFVANRVAKIQNHTDANMWKHVKSQDNPADHLSRGLLPSEILQADLYWNGPSFLHILTDTQPETISLPSEDDIPERRRTVTSNIAIEEKLDFNNFSSFTKAQRAIAYCLRFIHNSRSRDSRLTGPLSVCELQSAERTLIKSVQGESFSDELKILRSGKSLSKNSKLISLSPFLDEHEIIRVGGRLQQSNLTPDQIHPIVLPKKHKLTELIARYFHIKTLHAGPQLLLNVIRQRYWPINGKNLVNKIFHQCITCFKINPKLQTQFMGELPKSRVLIPPRAFYRCGVDYCGPFFTKMSKRKGITPTKCYIALFICFNSKAIHLELVEDLTTDSFIAALRRFISRRGKPKEIFSDNGTNFIGAHRELQELAELWANQEFKNSVVNALSFEEIIWHFQPPKAPHFGGLWESSVKLVKTHLKKCVGKSVLTYVQFVTLLTQVEACINSRPLTPLSESPIDLTPLTPSHFLICDILTTTAEPSLINLPINRLNHWQQIQQMLQHFWSRWSRDYLNGLQQRKKWTTSSPNPKVGDMVIIKEDNLPPLQWKMARVIEVHPGTDNKVRVVSVKTSSGVIKRPITKLCFLPLCDKDNNN